MGFMQPVVYKGTVLGIECENGESYTVETAAFNRPEKDAAAALVGCTDKAHGKRMIDVSAYRDTKPLAPFLPCHHVMRATLIETWIGYASAPGYLDRTDAQVFDTEAEAREYAEEEAGERDEESDEDPEDDVPPPPSPHLLRRGR